VRQGVANRELGVGGAHFDSGDAEVNDPRLQVSVGFDRQNSDGDGQLKAARAAGAGIEVEDAFLRDEIGNVSVAVKDSGEFGCGWIEMESLEVVQHVDVEAGVGRVFDEDDFGFGKFATDAFSVDVAANGGNGSDFGELVEDGDFSYVAAVQDTVDALESGSDFRTKETVGVGDDSELHVFRISRAGGGRLREGTYAN
jgi:hypothetical protein